MISCMVELLKPLMTNTVKPSTTTAQPSAHGFVEESV